MSRVREPKIKSGWLGLLYDRCASYTDNPVSEIARLAQQALNDGNIDSRRYDILKYRIPFHGVEWKSQKEVGRTLGVTGQMIRLLEHRIYTILDRRYLPKADL